MTFEVFRDDQDDWHWRLVDDDAQVVAVSPHGYANKKRLYEVIDLILALDQAETKDVKT